MTDLLRVYVALTSPLGFLPSMELFKDENGEVYAKSVRGILESCPPQIVLEIPRKFLQKTSDILEERFFSVRSVYDVDKSISFCPHDVDNKILEIFLDDYKSNISFGVPVISLDVEQKCVRFQRRYLYKINKTLKEHKIRIVRIINVTS